MIAPSGKFWMAIPRDRARAPARVMAAPSSAISPAKATPTAMPSGILWRVTAKTSMVLFFHCPLGPSGSSASMCRWGTALSRSRRNPIPRSRPTAAGRKASLPMAALISMAGIRRDQTEAATITPEAKPKSAFCIRGAIAWRRKNTQKAPAAVPRKGIIIPTKICINPNTPEASDSP